MYNNTHHAVNWQPGSTNQNIASGYIREANRKNYKTLSDGNVQCTWMFHMYTYFLIIIVCKLDNTTHHLISNQLIAWFVLLALEPYCYPLESNLSCGECFLLLQIFQTVFPWVDYHYFSESLWQIHRCQPGSGLMLVGEKKTRICEGYCHFLHSSQLTVHLKLANQTCNVLSY